MSVHSWMKQREQGCSYRLPLKKRAYPLTDVLNTKTKLWKRLYQKQFLKKDGFYKSYGEGHGVFDLKYTEDGNILVAACENNSMVLIDPLSYKTIYKKEDAHTLRCNTISFIDQRLFATCSDDSNVSIWDIRNMKESVLLLKGHMSWVKNVEYHKKTNLLVTSGFDDQVLAWNINASSSDHTPQLLLKCANLSRMRLSPDGNSMYLTSVLTADLIAIHNLDLDKLSVDVGKIESHASNLNLIEYESGYLSRDRKLEDRSLYQPIIK